MTAGTNSSRWGGEPTRGHRRVGCASATSPDKQRPSATTAATGRCMRRHRRKDRRLARGDGTEAALRKAPPARPSTPPCGLPKAPAAARLAADAAASLARRRADRRVAQATAPAVPGDTVAGWVGAARILCWGGGAAAVTDRRLCWGWPLGGIAVTDLRLNFKKERQRKVTKVQCGCDGVT